MLPTAQAEVGYMVSIWCATPEQRDQIGSAVAAGLSRRQFLAMPDGTAAHKRASGGTSSDKAENAGLFRRDLYFTLEITTAIAGTATPVLFPGAKIARPAAAPAQAVITTVGALAP